MVLISSQLVQDLQWWLLSLLESLCEILCYPSCICEQGESTGRLWLCPEVFVELVLIEVFRTVSEGIHIIG